MAILNLTTESSSLSDIYALIYGSYTGDSLLAGELLQVPFCGFQFHLVGA